MEKEKTDHFPFENLKKPTFLFYVGGGFLLLFFLFWEMKVIFSPFDEYRLSLVDAPSEVSAGQIATFTWRIDGTPTTIHKTVVYFGQESQPGELDKSVSPEKTKYPDFVRDFAQGNFDIPLQFIGNTTLTFPGRYYFRLYAEIKGKHYWSKEYSLEVKPINYQLTLVDAPKETSVGKITTFTWRIDGPKTVIKKTTVYYGFESTPGELGKETSPEKTKYTGAVPDFLQGEFTLPLQFIGNTKFTKAGTYYFRLYAEINGNHYWGKEEKLQVKEKKE